MYHPTRISIYILLFFICLIFTPILESKETSAVAKSLAAEQQITNQDTLFTSYSKSIVLSGNGTITDPYLVSNANELNAVRLHPNRHYRQTSDINLGVFPWNTGAGWVPIGDSDIPFSGTYNGAGFTISGLYLNRPSERDVSLFGFIRRASICNLQIANPFVSGIWHVGGIVGKAVDGSHIEHIVVQNANLSVSERYCGGVAGSIDGSTVLRCSSSGTITRGSNLDWNFIGGLVGGLTSEYGQAPRTAYIRECFSSVNLTSVAHNTYGGLVGASWYRGVIENSYSRGSVTGTNDRAGGFIGYVTDTDQTNKILNCYSTGYVNAPAMSVHGFAGHTGSCDYLGNFWDIQTSGQAASNYPAAEGKTTSQLQSLETFLEAGWDFNTIWDIDPAGQINQGYPFLRLLPLVQYCEDPVGLSYEILSETTIRVSWEPADNFREWELIWGIENFDPDEAGELVVGIYEPTYIIYGTQPGMKYDIYIRAICNGCENYSDLFGPADIFNPEIFSLTGGGVYCAGDPTNGFDIILEGSSIAYSYQLYRNGQAFGTVVPGTGSTLIWSNMIEGSYTVLAQGHSDSIWMAGSALIIELPLPLVNFTAPFDTICFDALPVVLKGGLPAGGNYAGAGVVQNVFFPELVSTGVHSLTYSYTNDDGCTGLANSIIVVDSCIAVPDIGIPELIQIFPNPTIAEVFIRIRPSISENIRLKIFSALGSLLFESAHKLEDNLLRIDLTGYPAGAYLFQIELDTGIYNRKLVVGH